MAMASKKFWVVWNAVRCSAVTPRYSTFEDAKNRAEELAHTNAGIEFVVMESKGSACTNAVTWESHEPVTFSSGTIFPMDIRI